MFPSIRPEMTSIGCQTLCWDTLGRTIAVIHSTRGVQAIVAKYMLDCHLGVVDLVVCVGIDTNVWKLFDSLLKIGRKHLHRFENLQTFGYATIPSFLGNCED